MSSKKSKDGTLNGMKMWNKYLVSIKVDKDSVNEENIQKLLKGFCTFLYEQVKPQSADDVKNNRPPVNYAAKSCTEYLAKVKEYYRKDNPNWKIWATHSDPNDRYNSWFVVMKHNLLADFIRRLIDQGKKLKSNKSRKMYRKQVIEAIKGFFGDDSLASAVEFAFMFGLNFQSVGRTAELSYVIWEAIVWDWLEGGFTIDWSMRKVGAEKIISFANDSSEYIIDVYWLMACYLLTGAGLNKRGFHDEDRFVFPRLAAAAAPSTTLGAMFNKYVGSQHSFKNNYSMISVRRGPISTIVSDRDDGGIETSMSRSGHKIGKEVGGATDEYVEWNFTLNGVGGRILGAWPNPRNHVKCPSLAPVRELDDVNNVQLNNFITLVFHLVDLGPRFIITEDKETSGDLKPLMEACFATFVMYLPEFVADFADHFLKSNFLAHARTEGFDWNMATFRKWSSLIKEKWRRDNCLSFLPEQSSDTAYALKALRKRTEAAFEEIHLLKTTIFDMKSQLQQVVSLLTSMSDAVVDHTSGASTPSSVSPKKIRKRRNNEVESSVADDDVVPQPVTKKTKSVDTSKKTENADLFTTLMTAQRRKNLYDCSSMKNVTINQ
jgi:hypothetical protein